MKPIFRHIINEKVKNRLNKQHNIPGNQLDKQVKDASIEFIHVIQDVFFILLGVLSASFGLRGFLLPNSFIDGGVTGISLIVAELSKVPFAILLVILNVPFMILALSTISKSFAMKSIGAIIILAIATHFIPYPTITDDKLLIAVFGGFFLGAGIGMAIRGGAAIDGTEVIAIYLSKKTHLTIGDVILTFNVILFMFATYVFSVEIALYAILTYLAAAKTVDFVVSGIEEYIGVTIISPYSEDIRLTIIDKLGRGCTLYSGKNGYARKGEDLKPTDIIYTLITRLELSKLQTEIEKVDKDAFIVMHSVKDAKGGMIKKRPMK